MTRRGALIVLEGCDRTGKSTQCQRLVDYLNSISPQSAKLCKFPDRTTSIGKTINSYLQNKTDIEDHTIHLLFSANRWEAMKSMEADLMNGITLVLDRYAYSGVAFSAAKGLDIEWCKGPDIGLLSPDLTIFLDLSEEEQQKRGGFGEERYETMELQRKVRQCFHKLCTSDWKVIDASQTVDEISRQIHSMATTAIEESAKAPLQFALFQQ